MGAKCQRRAQERTMPESDRLQQQIRDSWLLAVQEEDAEAAGWCARLCENLRGAEAFADSDGLDAFIQIAMGQSLNGQGGLMVALAQALMMEMSDFKVAIFETLCAAAQWPSLKGRIAGSGVLGVITATLLSPKHPPSSKALMVRLCGALAADSPEARELNDPRRAEEFARLRGQLIASGAVKAIVAMFSGDDGTTAAAAARAVEKLASGDDAIRAELRAAEAVPAMLRRLTALPDTEDEGEDDLVALESIAWCLSQLLVEGAAELVEPMLETQVVEDLCKVLGVATGRGHHGGFGDQRRMIQHLLQCLRHLGTRHGCWPQLGEILAEDLYGLILLRCDAAASYLQAILCQLSPAAMATCLQHFDVKRLHRALEVMDSEDSRAIIKTLDTFQSCQRCGIIGLPGSLSACGRCKLVAYCSKDCQRADWKSHKLQCQQCN